MRLEAVGNGRLRIWLTHEELQRWGIHSEALGKRKGCCGTYCRLSGAVRRSAAI